jgi:hypothetical protein
MKKAILLICLVGMLWSCEDEKTPVEFFEVTLDPTYAAGNDLWVIVHDQDGVVIDAKNVESGQTISFKSTSAPEKFSVTLLNYFSEHNFGLLTYHGESQNASWTLAGPGPLSNTGTSMGSLTVRVSDPQLGSPFVGQVSPGTGFQLLSSEANPDYLYTVQDVRSDRKYFLSVIDKNGAPYYKFLETPITGAVNYTLADLSSFNYTSNMIYEPTANYFAYGLSYEAGQRPGFAIGYLTGVRYGSTVTSFARLGITNRFANHLIFATATSAAGVVSNYEAFGPDFPATVNITTNVTATVANNSRDAFELSGEYDWYSNTYISRITPPGAGEYYRSWVIRGSDTSFKNLVDLPEEISALYPEINLDDFDYSSTNIYKDGRSYAEFLSSQFKGDHMTPYVERYRIYYQ